MCIVLRPITSSACGRDQLALSVELLQHYTKGKFVLIMYMINAVSTQCGAAVMLKARG
jgi:hypothetical protein